ncbi:MAG: polysaccharide deacetylase family protein [Defluviitaleaceae bacterium]|nr:polysaccharide deacetylase family protein [Defluviitaleaceae bacterium]
MYRSKLADERNLIIKLNIALVIVLVLLAGSAVFFTLTREKAQPAFSGDGATYETDLEDEPEIEPDPEAASSAAAHADQETTIKEDADMDEFILDEDFDPTPPLPRAELIALGDTGEYRAPRIALTFDDGPGWLTPQLLDILHEYEVRATFCVIGNLVANNAATITRAHEAGHEIVGHSWSHPDFTRTAAATILADINKTADIIEQIIGEAPPPIFRSPYGVYTSRVRNAARDAGYGVLNWSIDPRDWEIRDADHIYDFIIENARDGAIVLTHDIYQSTIDAMARAVPALVEMGYELVTASEMLEYVYGSIEPGFEYTGMRINGGQ